MAASRTTLSALLKNVYEGPIRDQINNPNVLLKFINRNSRDIIEGNQIVGSIRLTPSQGIGARGELSNLPTAGNVSLGQPVDNLRHLYGVMRLSGPVMRATENNGAAFARAVKAESDGLTLGLNLDLQRITYGTEADDGRFCLCGTSASGLIVTVADGTNMRYFEEGMLIDLNTASSGANIANGASRTVTAVDETGQTLTLDAAGGSVVTDATVGIYRAGVYGTSVEPHGLEAIVSTGSLHGLNPATAGNKRWGSNVVSNFGAFTSQKFQAQVDVVHNRSGKWITHIFSQEGPRNVYLNELQGMRRIVSQGGAQDNVKLDGGFSGLEYTGGGSTAVWLKDPYCTNTKTVIAVHLPDLELKRYADWQFMDVNGEYLLPDIYGSSGQDAVKAVMYMDLQLWALARNSHLKLQLVGA